MSIKAGSSSKRARQCSDPLMRQGPRHGRADAKVSAMDPSAQEPASPGYGHARRHGAVVTAVRPAEVSVSCRRDVALPALAELRRHFDRPLALEFIDSKAFDALLERQFSHGGASAEATLRGIEDASGLADLADAVPAAQDLLDTDDDAPVIRLINALLTEAVRERASDIHIEPFEDRVLVRMRIDGRLREAVTAPRAVAAPLASRIKVLAKLDIAERRMPQDGRFGLKIAGKPVDVRVSTIPANFGERVVLRLLDRAVGRLDFGALGMADAMQERLRTLIQRPHGLVLVTGPTGSGKTTTLYAALAKLNDGSRNILTVEDPVEYDLDGVGQTQVNPKLEFGFAQGLRAILRQDPDVVMVGEIRDSETARIAIQASLTGHLVLSTLHTNTASGAIARLVDIGAERYLLASSLVAVIAQRLVRRLDASKSEAYRPSAALLEALGRDPAVDADVALYRPGPDVGANGGYVGRTGIFELVVIDDALRDLIHGGASAADLERAARRSAPALADDAWRRLLAGETSVEEVLRATRDD